MTTNQLINRLTWAEVDARLEGDTRRIMMQHPLEALFQGISIQRTNNQTWYGDWIERDGETLEHVFAAIEDEIVEASQSGTFDADAISEIEVGGQTWRYRVNPAVRCQCAEALGLGSPCEWTGPVHATVIVEWMPPHLRASHEAAGNSGTYPGNGAVRLRCEKSCAARILADEDEADA